MDLVSIIQEPVIESILAAVILLSILAEIKTTGFSGGSLIAALSGCLLIGSNWYTGENQLVEFLLYFGGMAMIMMDLLLFMTGAMAAAGLAFVLAGLFFTFGGGISALYILVAALVVAAVLGYFLLDHLSESRVWQKLTLKSQLTGKRGFRSSSQNFKSYEGKQGITISVLRPSGKVEIEGQVLDAMSEGAFIEKGVSVVVKKAEGSYLIVRKSSC